MDLSLKQATVSTKLFCQFDRWLIRRSGLAIEALQNIILRFQVLRRSVQYGNYVIDLGFLTAASDLARKEAVTVLNMLCLRMGRESALVLSHPQLPSVGNWSTTPNTLSMPGDRKSSKCLFRGKASGQFVGSSVDETDQVKYSPSLLQAVDAQGLRLDSPLEKMQVPWQIPNTKRKEHEPSIFLGDDDALADNDHDDPNDPYNVETNPHHQRDNETTVAVVPDHRPAADYLSRVTVLNPRKRTKSGCLSKSPEKLRLTIPIT